MKIACISDTHGNHYQIDKNLFDGCQMVIHAGDFTYFSQELSAGFFRWFESLDVPEKILISGNHDTLAEFDRKVFDKLLNLEAPSVIYLQDSEYISNSGLKVYGSPWTPRFYDWAFNADQDIQDKWAAIPTDTDILVTHGPPYGVLDRANYKHLGCPHLRYRQFNLSNFKLHVYGHIHAGHGRLIRDGIEFVNAAMVNEKYHLVHKPYIINI